MLPTKKPKAKFLNLTYYIAYINPMAAFFGGLFVPSSWISVRGRENHLVTDIKGPMVWILLIACL